MKKTDIIIPVVALVILYLVAAFITMEFDPNNWSEGGRGFLCFVWLTASIFGIGITRSDI